MFDFDTMAIKKKKKQNSFKQQKAHNNKKSHNLLRPESKGKGTLLGIEMKLGNTQLFPIY